MRLLHSLAISLILTLVLELSFALLWGVQRRGLLVVGLMNLMTNPAAVLLHFCCVTVLGWTGFFPVLVLETAVVIVEGFCCRGLIPRPWLFSLCVNVFSYGIGELLQWLLR